MSDKNKKLDGISHGKAVRRTTPLIASQPSNNTNVYKDIETTKLKLRNLAERWIGVNKIKGFLTELWETLGINKVDNKQQKGGNPSRYAAFILQDGTILTITIRASAHNARAKNYLKKGNVNGDINLSIVLQKRSKKNRFEPNENVRLIEYVYLEDRISDIENPLSQIAMSLVGYLTNGQYIDTTGVAITPSKTEQIKEYKTNINMSKNKIRITENELKQIVSESVKKILSEARKPSDKTVGKHTLKGLRYDKNGNPLYTSDTMSDDEKKNQGWKFSKKHGMYGQLSDPTKLSESSAGINESISTDYYNTLKQLLAKSFSTLNENEKQFLYDLFNNEPWETIYTALNILGQNRVNEGVYTFKPNAASKEKGMIDNLNKKVDEIIKKRYPNTKFYYEDDEAYDAYAEALLNLGFKKDGRDRNDCEVFSNGTLRVVIHMDSINYSLIIDKANGYASTLGLY